MFTKNIVHLIAKVIWEMLSLTFLIVYAYMYFTDKGYTPPLYLLVFASLSYSFYLDACLSEIKDYLHKQKDNK